MGQECVYASSFAQVAKGTWYGSKRQYSVEEHLATNPFDSQWVSLTTHWGVACYFAVSQKDGLR